MSDRKSFQNLPREENPHFLLDGREIYLELAKKYGVNSVEGLDSILNVLCSGLIHLVRINVGKDDHENVLQLIHKILSKNL